MKSLGLPVDNRRGRIRQTIPVINDAIVRRGLPLFLAPKGVKPLSTHLGINNTRLDFCPGAIKQAADEIAEERGLICVSHGGGYVLAEPPPKVRKRR